MEAMNRAIEGAADFGEFKRRLLQAAEDQRDEVAAALKGQKRPGENREQFRARLRAEHKTQKV